MCSDENTMKTLEDGQESIEITEAEQAVGMDLDQFITYHKNQLESSVVPSHYWPTLHEKLANEIFDSANVFQILKIEDENEHFLQWKVIVNRDDGIKSDDPQHIYLIDHAWTFRPDQIRSHLQGVPGLRERIANLLNLEKSEHEDMDVVVMSELWKLAGTYSVGNAGSVEERMPIWYVMDEFGSRIQNICSEQANVRIVPFINLMDGCAYSLLFPVKNIEKNQEIARDYLEGPEAQDDETRKALLNTWEFVDLTNILYKQEEPGREFFEQSRENESLPVQDVQYQPLPMDRKIKVYAEYIYIGKNLKHPRFEMVDSIEEADVIWLTTHFKDFKNFSQTFPGKRINQFPYENVITIKDLLCIVCRRESEGNVEDEYGPKWLPTTYNLKTELPKFVSYFQHRQNRGLDNHWIIKPWNLARGLDTQISCHLHHILRLPFSGPKIAQKYLENPVLFDRPDIGKVKFDIRYILLLSSTDPLQVYAYNRFWLRFANQKFELKDLDIYEKHFTVMNYTDEENLKQMFCHDFIVEFERQYPDFKWVDIENEIFKMFKSVFVCATSVPPPCGISPSPQSRAMYAADLMLAWEKNPSTGDLDMQPKLLEINWGPDCKRACDYYPEYFDNVFATLFLDSPEGQNVTLL